jgi:UDP-N-acetylmuramate--alanine ligase
MTDEQIIGAVDLFRGVKRRFEYQVKGKGMIYIDDYAHHPKELEALISSAKALYPEKQCVVIFQPHLFSRTKDFAGAFAASLDLADAVILLPIYPARELPMEGISSATLLDKMNIREKRIMEKEAVLDWIRGLQNKDDLLLITAGAGNIDSMVKPITEIIKG